MEFKNAPSGWRIKSTKKVYDSEYIKLYEDQLDINGKKKVYYRGVRRDYSTIVPFVSENEILVIQSYRHMVDSIQLEVPSGYIEEGETPEQAASRELEEETGYRAKRIMLVGSYTLDYTMFMQKGYIFAAYDLANIGNLCLGDMEKIEATIMPISEIKDLLFNGTILNAASIVALLRALDYHYKKSK